MLSIYGRALKPDAELNTIIELTKGYEEKTLKKWQRISSADSGNLYVILNGEMEFRRRSDELCMFPLRSNMIFGLGNIFYQTDQIIGVACADTVVRIVPKEAFLQLIAHHQCWLELTKVLSWYICILNKRDDMLVARSAYTIIREFLIEINELMALYKRDINVYDYIQEYTNLARSTIIKILSELKKGQYVVIEKGRLVKLNTLPEKY
ncbi:helix-turn-helix domain-containing protein [Entomohabitans teleogrylli]|uniref:helix-turn-helix domain-containing protein n=1 Tax=Entomohabitans teleogrylli TaxID=1384589 RepID=UPI00073D7F2E|nr:helix-turn-helix domain-containing protein [Entomohabitans teleogrylli]